MTRSRCIVVDGYNVLRRVPEWDEAFRKDRIRARDMLAMHCANWRNGRRDVLEVVIVYDGAAHVEDVPSPGWAGVRIVFARGSESADRWIMDFVRQRGGGREITVVSDDAEIARTARACRAEVLSVAEFRRAREPRQRPGGGGPSDKVGPRDRQDIDTWLRAKLGLDAKG